MEEEERGPRLSKRFSDTTSKKGGTNGEVDYNTKAGTAWSHSYLNQKPWHPLSYPNQRRKWIAEQTHSHRQHRAEEIAREYEQEQEFLRQTSLLSQKEKEKVDIMQAVSFMYVRPPGYNAESAKAAEIAEERKKLGETDPTGASSSSMPQEAVPVKEEKKKPRPKDVFGRALPTEEEFAVLKNAPRLETGVPGRVKPFAVEVRNVKCVRCGNFGHQSGDRECPLKDVIMPNDENRLKRDDPLTTIIAHMDSSEPLKWELKQKPGISPPRGGFMPDDPNQQIVAEDIFDEYGGFLSGGGLPELLTSFSSKKHKKKPKSKSKPKKQASCRRSDDGSSYDSDDERKSFKTKIKSKSRQNLRELSTDSDGENDYSSESSERQRRSRRIEQSQENKKKKKKGSSHSSTSEDSPASDGYSHRRRSRRKKEISKRKKKKEDLSHSSSSSDDHGRSRDRNAHRSEHENYEKHRRTSSPRQHRKSRVSHGVGSSNDHGRSRNENSHRSEHEDYDKHRRKGSPKQPKESWVSHGVGSSDDHGRSRDKNSRRFRHGDYDKSRRKGSPKQCRESRVGSSDGETKPTRKGNTHRSRKTNRGDPTLSSSENSEFEGHKKRRHEHSYPSEDPDSNERRRSRHDREHLHHNRYHRSDSSTHK